MDSMASDDRVTIEPLSATKVREGSIAKSIEQIYLEAFSGRPYYEDENSASAFVERLLDQTDREGWRLLTAQQKGHIQGFVYGHVSRPGQWWHDRVVPRLDSTLVDRWFEGCFVIVEFAVRPAAHGQGIGSKLHDAILDHMPVPKAVTMTNKHDNPAVDFYLNRGWQVLRERFRFHDEDVQRLILGRELQR